MIREGIAAFLLCIYVYTRRYIAWKTGERGGRSTKRSDTSVNFPVITGRDFTANETGPRVPRCTVIFCRIYGGKCVTTLLWTWVSLGNHLYFFSVPLPLSLIVVAARCLCKFLIFIRRCQEAAYRLPGGGGEGGEFVVDGNGREMRVGGWEFGGWKREREAYVLSYRW